MTIFLDIDGCILKHHGSMVGQINNLPVLLPGVLEKFIEWDRAGHVIILTTGRRESTRKLTENALASLGLFWDQLIMGVGRGKRVIINDLKPDGDGNTCEAINVIRNEGLTNVSI
jgi:hypothetical protein